MAEPQPPADPQVNGGAPPGYTLPPATIPPPTDLIPSGPTKRQRRPSVRLGEIGDHQNPNPRFKFNKFSSKSSKIKPIMNLSTNHDLGIDFNHENMTLDSGSHDFNDIGYKDGGKNGKNVGIGSWKVKDSINPKRPYSGFSNKRVRSNWVVSKSGGDDEGFEDVGDEDFDDVDKYSDQNLDADRENGFGGVRVSDGPSGDSNLERNGVRVWLNQLGLGRYYSVFEVHEVDDEVLPLLTLEDLKDMGINAVGSRRKMFCSIQKLGKGFS